MTKCPFCHYENEDGALFCERCSSDLSTAVPVAAPKPPPPPPPVPAMPMPVPMPVPMPMPMPMPATAHAAHDDIPIAMAEPLPEHAAMDAIPVAMAEAVDDVFSAPLPPVDLAPLPAALEPAAAQPVPAMELAPVHLPEPPAAQPVPAMELSPVHSPEPPLAAPAHTPATSAGGALPAGAQPRLLVLRGQKRNVEYPVFEGLNYVGRADEKPVDIDLEEQEPPDRIWCSRQHAVLNFDGGTLTLEDLNSANGTYINRTRVYPGQPKVLAVNDIIQIGNVQMKVII